MTDTVLVSNHTTRSERTDTRIYHLTKSCRYVSDHHTERPREYYEDLEDYVVCSECRDYQ